MSESYVNPYTLVEHSSGRGWMEVKLLTPKGELERLPLVMDDPRWGYMLTGYGQTYWSDQPDGKLALFIVVEDKDGYESVVKVLASESEIDEITGEFRRHFRNKVRRERRREAEAKKSEAAVTPYVFQHAA